MYSRLKFFLNRVRERLWVKPLVLCFISIAAVFLARAADQTSLAEHLPWVSADTIEALLKISASSMLVIATFAVGTMVASYGSASAIATPRAFKLVLADDVSQNALSSFIGAFIFSIVALIAQMNGYYGVGGRFTLFILTLLVLLVVILMFVRWVDCIARLGRMGPTIAKVEAATAEAINHRRRAPTLGGIPAGSSSEGGLAVFRRKVGYVQRVEVAELNECAREVNGRIVVAALPGTFATPDRPLAFVKSASPELSKEMLDRIQSAFQIGDTRTFDEDPRFGLVVLSEIAGRSLSPAMNDPGTAIGIIGTCVRLFVRWSEPVAAKEVEPVEFDRVEVPELSTDDLFDDAFTPIARDGAGSVEVVTRLLKALESLSATGDHEMAGAARRHARLALARAERSLNLPEDLAIVRALGEFALRDKEEAGGKSESKPV